MFAIIIPFRPSGFSEEITYEISVDEKNAEVGDLVEIALGNRRDKGIIINITDEIPSFTTKKMGKILAKKIFSLSLLRLYIKISQYFFFSPSFCLKKSTPKHIIDTNFIFPKHQIFILASNIEKKIEECNIKGKKQLELIHLLQESSLTKKEILDSHISSAVVKTLQEKGIIEKRESEIFPQKIQNKNKTETDEENKKHENFSKKIFIGSLYSKKTIEEIEFIQQIIEAQKQVCIIFPDKIILEQTLKKYKKIFSDITPFHNGLGKKEENLHYWKIRTGNCSLIFGLQNALFTPFHCLGAIIIFEYSHQSHCSLFSPYIKTPEVAEIIAKEKKIPLILSSSSGDISHVSSADEKNITLFPSSFKKNIIVADIELEQQNKNFTPLSGIALEKMKNALEKNEKIVLFFNRKGMHTSVFCTACKDIPVSPYSGIRMSVFKDANGKILLRCSQSGYCERYREQCKKCGGEMKKIGEGTQNIESFLEENFTEKKILRIDGDSLSSKSKIKNISDEIEQSDIIIGTQIIFSLGPITNCSTVIDVLFENSLSFPSLIAEEKTWIQSHLLQELLGKTPLQNVIIQTFQPELPLIKNIEKNDFLQFYTQEIKARKTLEYPPFSENIIISCTGKNQKILEKNIEKILPIIQKLNGKYFPAQFSILPHQQKVKAEMQCFFPLKTNFYDIKILGFQLQRFGEWR